MLTTLTGVSYTLDDYLKAGERIWNLERMFNLKADFTSADDNLPERLLKCPIKTGPSKGEVSHLADMLPEYYQLRGWDEHGCPRLKDQGTGPRLIMLIKFFADVRKFTGRLEQEWTRPAPTLRELVLGSRSSMARPSWTGSCPAASSAPPSSSW